MDIFWTFCQWLGFSSLVFSAAVVAYGLLIHWVTKPLTREYREF